jgi:hypothetical protein
MLKTVTIFLLIIIPVLAQTESEDRFRALLEEHGSTMINTESGIEQYFRDSASVWNPLLPAPNGFGRAIVAAIGDYVYVFNSQGNTTLAIAYHISTNTWVNSTPCTAPGYNSGFCVAKGDLYKASGTGSAAVFEKFTPAGDGTGTWTVLTSAPTTVMNAQNSLAWDGADAIYFYSGSYTSPYPSYMVKYNIGSGTFETKTGSLHTRRYNGMAAAGKYIYVIGGLVADATSGAICQRYDVGNDTWSLIANLPEEINFAKWSVTSDGNYIYVLGSGGGYSTYPHSPNAWYYDPATDTWAHETALPAPRGLVHGTYLPSVNKLFWGGGNNTISSTAYQPDIWEGIGGVYTPVELISFTADLYNESVVLKWKTAAEKNNSHFVVERSTDGVLFEDISVISGAGTSLSENVYSYNDLTFKTGNIFYRLKQVDYDGSFSYSDIISVSTEIPLSFVLEQNFPNPFNPSTVIRYSINNDCNVVMQVYDPLGNCITTLVNENKKAGSYSVTFNADDFSSGVYYYKLTAGESTGIKKLLLLK